MALFINFVYSFRSTEYVRKAGWWILATAIGWSIGFIVGLELTSGYSVTDKQAVIIFIVLGASLGLTQWLVIRSQVQYAGWWIFANTTIWSFSGFAGISIITIVNGASITISSSAVLTSIATFLIVAESIRGFVLFHFLLNPFTNMAENIIS